jgi:ABC-2 type transport system ATP-binding protein
MPTHAAGLAGPPHPETPMTHDPAIETIALTRSFGGRQVLREVDLRVEPGTVYGLLGPNGAGKTTLVRILATLLPPHGGSARVVGRDVVAERASVRAAIGLTGQYASIDGLLTGEENLVQLGRLLGLGRRGAAARAADLLERFELTDAARRRVATYSGGMRRRLDLAASLLGQPAVLFLDEPTTGLDPRSRRTLWEITAELARGGTTVLLTTQYLEEADHLADRIGVLHDGRLVVEGTARELKARVGQQLLTVTVPRADLDRAAGLLGASESRVEEATSRVGAPLRDVDHLRELLAHLAHAGIPAADVEVAAPTLDDVFLALTSQETAA